MAAKDFKKKKVFFKSPKYVPELKFRSQEELKKSNSSFLFWSENRNSKSPHGTFQNEFLDYVKEGKIFHAFIGGETMEGKGVTLENLVEYYKKSFEDYVIIDVSGKNYEGCFWAKNYKCYCVYPQLIKPKKPSTNPNVIEKKLNHKNPWKKLIRMASRHKRILILMCRDPLEKSTLKAQRKLFEVLNKDEDLAKYRKVLLLREISFIGYKHGKLKMGTGSFLRDTKREFLNLCRTGRHGQNQIIADAQDMGDIDNTLKDNVALKIIKRTNTFVGNYPKYVQEAIKKLKKHQAIMEFRGKLFTATIGYNGWHKKETDKVEDIGIFPTKVVIDHFNKLKENRYIDRVAEEWTNYENRLIIGRRRHIQDPENSKLCNFELADLLGLETEIWANGNILMKKPKLVYGEIKFRSEDSKHPRIETGDVKKTIQDLMVKKITWDHKKNCYFFTLDPDIIKALSWHISQDYEPIKVPCQVEMITPQGATKGAMALIRKHHIYLRTVKIDDTFYQ